MDLLGSVLQSLRIIDINLTLLELAAPYGYEAATLGDGWIFISYPLDSGLEVEVGRTRTWLNAGDVAVALGATLSIRSQPGLPVVPILEAWRERKLPELGPKIERSAPGHLPLGSGGRGAAKHRCIAAALMIDEVHQSPILSVLPSLIVLRKDNAGPQPWSLCVSSFTEAETQNPRPGYNLMARQLVSAWFMALIRAYALETRADKASWLRGISDPQVGRVLGLMHGDFGRDWHREEIAKACGMSATTLSRRFLELVGRPPMEYLGSVRMHAAAQMLVRKVPVSVVAQEVGYASEWAFRKAFHKEFGVAPLAYGRQMSNE